MRCGSMRRANPRRRGRSYSVPPYQGVSKPKWGPRRDCGRIAKRKKRADAIKAAAARFFSTSSLFRIQLSPRIQVIKMQDGIEHERIRSDRLPTVDRVDREEYHVPL